jgi:hypothetical protein
VSSKKKEEFKLVTTGLTLMPIGYKNLATEKRGLLLIVVKSEQ